MMNLMLDDETERYLIEILAAEKIPSDRLIKKILRDRWLTHQPKKTILERMGGEPEHLLEGPGNLSNREVRKKAIAEYVEQPHQRRLENRKPESDFDLMQTRTWELCGAFEVTNPREEDIVERKKTGEIVINYAENVDDIIYGGS